MSHTWSTQQQAIFDWFEKEQSSFIESEINVNGHLVCRARAGTGKTTVIIEGVKRAPERSILICAFSKIIQKELEARIGKNFPYVKAQTLHSVGYRCVRNYRERINVDFSSSRAELLTETICGRRFPDAIKKLVTKLHTKGREIAPHAEQLGDLTDIAIQFECIPDDQWQAQYPLEIIEEFALKAMELASNIQNGEIIDGSDMIFLPVRNGWLHGMFDLIVVDECLPGWTPVMLADGSSMTIKEIVESNQEFSVRSYDVISKQEENCKVIGKQKILNQKPLVKIKVDLKSPHSWNFVICTIDHKIWTNRGWIEAGKIKLGDKVIVETAAQKTQKGKITKRGKEDLSTQLLGNTRGIENIGGNPDQFNSIKGGNGFGLTLAEQVMTEAFGEGWINNFVVSTGEYVAGIDHIKGWPSHYKIDIANPEKKIAVEIDGKTHGIKTLERDTQKDLFLKALGWHVFRITNQRAIQNTNEEVCRIIGNCPKEATVIEISPVIIKDNYVYDITVEDCHNFYANGILVHNCQDMTTAQLEIAQGVLRKEGRICIVGDDRQAIFGFRGADSSSLDRLKGELNAGELGLTTTYRCGKKIVEIAKSYVPDFDAGPTNSDGEILELEMDKLVNEAQPGDYILSRINAPLVSIAMQLLRQGKRTRIAGRDIGKGLITLIRKMKARSVPDFLNKVASWEMREMTRLSMMLLKVEIRRKASIQSKIDDIQDQAEMLVNVAQDAKSINEIEQRVENLFMDDGLGIAGMITCSSVHRAKGLEANRVFIIQNTLRNHNLEEQNIVYVAVTRAKQTLTWVVERK